MIVAEIFAGLGNQMFQYAAVRALAERLQVPLKLNIQAYRKNIPYPFDLNKFNITAEIATAEEVEKATSLPQNVFKRNCIRIFNLVKPKEFRRVIIREQKFHFEDELSRATKNCYVFGHWQSEKYFKPYENIIRQEFTLKEGFSDQRIQLKKLMELENSVSLVVRRGDFLKHPQLNLYGEDMTYHYQAIQFILERIDNPHFFVFSDDIDWVKQHLQLPVKTVFVSQPCLGEEYKLNPFRHQDMMLIKECKHHIITNSTFAWWGAWLSIYPNKIIIAPKKWFGDNFTLFGKRPDTKDVVPDNWIKL